MPEMKILSEHEAFVLLDDGPNGLPLVQQIAQTLLEANVIKLRKLSVKKYKKLLTKGALCAGSLTNFVSERAPL